MNKQKVFNKVYRHLMLQGEKSVDLDDTCMYRGEHGRQCAIGVLIPDKLYDKGMECQTVVAVLDANDALKEHLGVTERSDVAFLGYLQDIHDGYRPELWKEKFLKFAEDYGLRVPEVK